MKLQRYWVMICAALTALMLSAAEPPANSPAAELPAPTTTPAATVTTVPAPGAAPEPASAATTPATTAAAADAAHNDAPERFEATEKVRADFEVSFPVDI